MTEKQFENKVKNFLKSKNIYYFKVWGNAFQRAGIPDIIACVNGKFIGIELKSEKGRASELQLWNIKKIRESGGFAGVYYPKDFERLKGEINAIISFKSWVF